MLEKMIVEQCAPTLANMKTANLFNYKYDSLELLQMEIDDANQKLNTKGVYIKVLKFTTSRALIYVYRKKMLEADMKKAGVDDLLKSCGYEILTVEACLEQLQKHLQEHDCFPHEIGIFLGYPLCDVIGFIEHGGKNCKYCGIWKVYSNECETKELFARFRKCAKVYAQVFTAGKSIVQMTVVA